MVFVASLFGCSDRYGTYITISAPNEDLRFDRLELYYGIEVGSTVPTTPKHLIPEPADLEQLLVVRAFSPSDLQIFKSRQSEYTVWIPDGGQNDALGAYLLAVAYVGDQRVGIAELFDFQVTDERKVFVYTMTLEAPPVDSIEEWGRGETRCLRIARPRPPDDPVVVAIVDPHDSDCDLFLDRSPTGATDCEPLLYCDGLGVGDCVGRSPCVHDADSCSIGSCSNKDGASITCEDETCVSDILCTECDLSKSPAEILDCALLANPTHPIPDISIPIQGNQLLCIDPMVVEITLPFPCTNPTVDAVGYFYTPSDPFEFSIAPGAMSNVCLLTMSSTRPDSAFSGAPHLLVTVQLMPPRRTGFVVGLLGRTGACPDANEPIERDYEPIIGTCPLP